jgi:nucleotide-binding universal stress UspA family protein
VRDDEQLAPAESVPLGGGQFKAERDQIVLAEAEHHLEVALKEFDRSCQIAGVQHKSFMTRGNTVDRLTEHAQRADLLVVGRKRLESTESIVPITDTLATSIKRAVRPIVCVSGPTYPASSVLVAYDGSPQAARTLAAFVGLGLFADLRIRLITVEKSLGDLAYDTTLASEFLEGHGYKIDVTCFTSDEAPGDALLRLIDETRPALVVLGAFGKSWLREVFLGSVTTTLLRKSNAPLFLYH